MLQTLGRAAVVTAVCLAGLSGPTPASACACGAIASTDGNTSVTSESALLTWDGRRETILMQLDLDSGLDRAALVVPTPAPAEVAAGHDETFTELHRLTAPTVAVHRRWFGRTGDAMVAGAAPGAPQVLDRVQLGPLEATTLAAGDLPGLQNWLHDNGYALRSEVTATLQPYVDQHWSFVALKLTSATPLNGPLDPVRLSFDAAHPVYPMRMSRAASTPQEVRLYLLADHRQQRTDPDAGWQRSEVEFAGRLSDSADPEIRAAIANGADYLTAFTVGIAAPDRITSDFSFARNHTDDPVRPVVYRTEDVTVFGQMAGPVLVAAGIAAAFALLTVAVRRRRH